MKLPGAQSAQVDTGKVAGYLLNLSHPVGRNKALFFMSFGYDPADPERLCEDLRQHGRAHPVVEVAESPYGKRYNIDGVLSTPDGRNPTIRTVWIVEENKGEPRLITAHPVERRDRDA
jgi:hypothetical protein